MTDSIPFDLFILKNESVEPSDLPEALDFCSDEFAFVFISHVKMFPLADLLLGQVR